VRLKLISCEVLYREICDAVAHSPHQVDVEFLTKGLHDVAGAGMCCQLQAAVDRVDAGRHDAVLLGYALCGNGVAGLEARNLPVVIPRAHDCIGLLMGSRHRYEEFFTANPGTYFRSTGWLERGQTIEQLSIRSKTGAGLSFRELADKYGEENARYLYEELHRYRANYNQLVFIETGLEPDSRFEDQARREAGEKGWRFTKLAGDLNLFRRLAGGDWGGEDFVVAQPGWRFVASYDGRIIDTERIPA
jgi:hypothetical protein